MPWVSGVLLVYAFAIFGGGIAGYYVTSPHSTVSLFSSGAAAVLILLGVYVAQKRVRLGYGICEFAVGLLIVFFAVRLAAGKTMPAVPGLALSLIAIVCLSIGHAKISRATARVKD